jgi:phosphohistidine phosphatase
MLLYLVRHAPAANRSAAKWPDDADRPLTRRGKRRFRRAARGLRKLGAKVDVLLSSRYARAWRTAELLAKEADWPAPVPCPELEGGASPAEVVAALQVFGSHALAAAGLVGHQPLLSEMTSYLLAGDVDRLRVALKKGAVVCLDVGEVPEPGRAALLWLAQPKLLRGLAR